MVTLKPYQYVTKENAKSRLLRGDQVLIGYEMGLGKTFTSLCIAKDLLGVSAISCIIVCAPASLLSNWVASAARVGVAISTHSYDQRTPPIVDDTCLVILDESQSLKNRQSARWKRLRGPLFRTTFRILLSGTPMPNKPVELYTQLLLLGMKQSWIDFTTRFCDGRSAYVWIARRRKKIWDTSGASHIDELKVLLKESGATFLTKEEVLSDLPKLEHFVHWVKREDKGHRKRIRSSVVEYATTLVSERIRNGAVWAKVVDLCREEPRTIVFAKHKLILSHIEVILRGAAIETTTIDGSTDVRRRQSMLSNAAEQGHIAICSVGAVGTGFNATDYTQLIFVESSWSAGDRMQCEARIHRIGQVHNCVAHYVFIEDTIDAHLWKTLLRKATIISNVHAS